MSFEKFWQWKGPSPCEIKWRSPISRAAICLFLLPTSCTTIQATFSFINTRTFTMEQTGPKFRGKKKNKLSGVTQTGARNQPLKPSPTQARPLFGKQRKVSLVHKIPPVPGEGMNQWAWGTSHRENWLFTHTEIKYFYKFFCKVIPHSSGLKVYSSQCQTNVISLNAAGGEGQICIIDKCLWLVPFDNPPVSFQPG